MYVSSRLDGLTNRRDRSSTTTRVVEICPNDVTDSSLTRYLQTRCTAPAVRGGVLGEFGLASSNTGRLYWSKRCRTSCRTRNVLTWRETRFCLSGVDGNGFFNLAGVTLKINSSDRFSPASWLVDLSTGRRRTENTNYTTLRDLTLTRRLSLAAFPDLLYSSDPL